MDSGRVSSKDMIKIEFIHNFQLFLPTKYGKNIVSEDA